MTQSLRENLNRVSDPENLEMTVDEVFQMMLGTACHRTEVTPSVEAETITAVVGFGGVLSGACVFRCGASVALSIAERLTGMEFDEMDETVKDAIGEVCNMLAGAWKGRVPQLAAHCGLSIPAVITGSDYRIHVQAPEFQLNHIYRFDELSFTVNIVCDGLQ